MRTYEYNGITKPFDIYDVDTLERYENALIKLGKAEKSIPKDGKQSDIIRAECDALRTAFDDILGEGTADSLFGERRSMAELMDAYEKLLQTVSDQRIAMQSRIAKYSPNRVRK